MLYLSGRLDFTFNSFSLFTWFYFLLFCNFYCLGQFFLNSIFSWLIFSLSVQFFVTIQFQKPLLKSFHFVVLVSNCNRFYLKYYFPVFEYFYSLSHIAIICKLQNFGADFCFSFLFRQRALAPNAIVWVIAKFRGV